VKALSLNSSTAKKIKTATKTKKFKPKLKKWSKAILDK
jgi:hypothetical protein